MATILILKIKYMKFIMLNIENIKSPNWKGIQLSLNYEDFISKKSLAFMNFVLDTEVWTREKNSCVTILL